MENVTRMPKVLITGSRGFIGARLVKRLREAFDVSVVEVDLKNGLDVTCRETFTGLEAVDVVVHLAADLFVPHAFENPGQVYRSNILGTVNVLDYCREKNVKRIIYASSYVYGTPVSLPVSEERETNIQNPYGRSKLIGEMLCAAYFTDYGIVPIILRPFNIYGPGQAEHFLIPRIIRQILTEDIVTVRDLTPRRDYLFVDDVVEAYIQAIFKCFPKQPETFNVGLGRSYSVEEIIVMIQELAGTSKPVIAVGPVRQHEVPDCFADVTKITNQLSWSPKYNLGDGLKATIASYMAHV
jgi:UDP-glucose 4-epimerase